ncbi:hypothetical protein SBRCBS47491_004491 [Sporothrix bragantina]|uniref:Major facilitator superfamily (MFS) profile domain-containing protein n=1 Tax=Sporothrix bragantina TaxID=671064 RepID=A0ABP0BQD7_9PEZI
MAHKDTDEILEVEMQEQRVEPSHDSAGLLMRTKEDSLGIWATVLRHKRVGLIAMTAAFCASLDGYQINLNGNIVANKGFIRQMASPGTTIIAGKYVSAWGGIQSTGQAIGQILLQYVTEGYGRKPALLVILVILTASIFTESFATHWDHWLVAKLFSGMGVGKETKYAWAMIGAIGIVFALLPETPWWLVSQGKIDKARKSLEICNGDVKDYDFDEQLEVMSATVAAERRQAEMNNELGQWAVFQGRNLLRFFIAGWPKIAQQFVGLSVFNTYAAYFFQKAGNTNPFMVTIILSCVQLMSMIATAVTTDRFGRRPLTVYPYAVTVASVLSLGIIGCFNYSTKSLSSLLIFFACLATFSTTGASAIGYAYATEIPRQRLRARTSAWALALSNMISIMFSFCTPLMINGTAGWGVKTGFFFAGTGAVATLIAWFILPEVARRTPAEIDEMFILHVPLRKFKSYVTEVQMRADQIHDMQVKGA